MYIFLLVGLCWIDRVVICFYTPCIETTSSSCWRSKRLIALLLLIPKHIWRNDMGHVSLLQILADLYILRRDETSLRDETHHLSWRGGRWRRWRRGEPSYEHIWRRSFALLPWISDRPRGSWRHTWAILESSSHTPWYYTSRETSSPATKVHVCPRVSSWLLGSPILPQRGADRAMTWWAITSLQGPLKREI